MNKFITDRKPRKSFDYYGTGFKIRIENLDMIKVFGEWTPEIDYQEIDNLVFEALATKPARLTGHEIQFIRLHSEMTLIDFGKHFDMSHTSIAKWEKQGDDTPNMNLIMEKEIRMFILNEIKTRPAKFIEFWREMIQRKMKNSSPAIKVDAKELTVI